MKRWKLLLVIPLILILFGGYYFFTHSSLGIDKNNLPKFIQQDFVDLSKIYSISKFRSGSGHDFSGGGETCRSMKHYFQPNDYANAPKDANGIPPKPDGINDISIYSPVDGTIASVSEEHTPIGKQVSIIPSKQSHFNIRLFHVYVDAAHKQGTKVKAGEKIGVIGQYQGTDISVQIGTFPWEENFVSYFDVMPDSLFAKYQERGIKSRDDLIITKAYRDAHPLKCGDGSKNDKASEMFVYPADYDHNQDEVHLSGYVKPTYQTQPQQNQNQNQSQQSNY